MGFIGECGESLGMFRATGTCSAAMMSKIVVTTEWGGGYPDPDLAGKLH
jgi:hypothetical protein